MKPPVKNKESHHAKFVTISQIRRSKSIRLQKSQLISIKTHLDNQKNSLYSITLATRTMTSYGLSQIVNVEIIVRLTRVKSLLAISNEASKKSQRLNSTSWGLAVFTARYSRFLYEQLKTKKLKTSFIHRLDQYQVFVSNPFEKLIVHSHFINKDINLTSNIKTLQRFGVAC